MRRSNARTRRPPEIMDSTSKLQFRIPNNSSRSTLFPRSPKHSKSNILIVVIAAVAMAACFYRFVVFSGSRNNSVKKKFGIVIDGGSTGTRVHVFEYGIEGGVPKFDFTNSGLASMRVNPGLSAYADKPEAAGGSLVELIEFAKGRVPKKYWGVTDVRLMATAGMRLLDSSPPFNIQNLHSSIFSYLDPPLNFIMSESNTTPNSTVPKNKSAVITVQETKIASPAADFLTLFQSNSAARSDTSNQWTIDVFPNMVSILMYVMVTSLDHANKVEHRDHSKVSVATICMYYMSVVYGYFLLNDVYVRPAPSAQARSWKEISWKKDFLRTLNSLPVPEFLVPILQQFKSFTTDRTMNVFFIPSAAGFDHNIFFGRVFPLSMFAAIHDCTAILPGNSTRMQVLQDLYSRVLYTIRNPAFSCLIPDLIGISIDQTTATTANYMNSKLYQIFTAVFNPVLFRDFQRRSSLAALSFQPPSYATNHINAYDLLFSATSANVRELKVVLQAVTAVLGDVASSKKTLCQLVDENSGAAIIKHGYSTFALPTWIHGANQNKPALFNALTVQNLVTEDERAQDISFLQRPNAAVDAPHAVRDVIYATTADPNTPVPLPANHQITRYMPFDLVLREDAANPFPRHDNDDLVQFDETLHTNPSVLVLDTDGDQTITAHLATLSGKIVESFELDGSTIEMPNALKSLGMQNCLFADSAIAYKYAIPGSAIRPRAAGTFTPTINRAPPNSRPRLPASSLLYDRTKIMLPQLNPHIVDNDLNALPGFTVRTPVNQVRAAQSFIGFRTTDSSSNLQANDAVPGMPDNRILLWSPYSYTPFESDDLPEPDLSASRHYFLCNLRTIFGTDYNLVQVKHPYEAMPVV